MGNILIAGFGSAVDLDVVTAEAGDVVAGKVIVDKNGNPLTGTLTLTGNAGPGDVLNGITFYSTNPKSKQTGTLSLSGNAGTGDVRKGKTFYSTNAKSKQTGTMAEKGAATYTPGTSNQVISANQYLTGAQTILGDADLVAANIVSGKNIFGVAGNAHKYGRWLNDVATSGSGTFYYTGNNGSDYLPYLSITGFGFTPLAVTASIFTGGNNQVGSFDGWNYVVGGKLTYKPSTGSAKFGYNNIVMPVPLSGSYEVLIVGYY